MGDNIIPRQQGDDYQAIYFWYQACNLYLQNSTAIRVTWENNDVHGFDDVSIHYEPAQLDYTGEEVQNKYYQVKFHVDHDKGFSCDALVDPEFIGAKKESILQRLHKNYLSDKETFLKSRYFIVNTWGVDYSDPLKNLLDNNGGIRMEKLFDGTGEESKMGKIRVTWRSHLKLTNDIELREVLNSLRIYHNAKGIEAFNEEVNFRLSHVGFKPISDTQRTSPYASLIKQLHSEKRKTFTKYELLAILEREQLLIEKSALKDNVHRIGVRSFKRGTDTIKYETDEYLCLLPYFSGRFASNYELWRTTILPLLSNFSEKVVGHNKPLEIHLDTHLSIAFTMGYFIDNKVGVSTSIWQKGPKGRKLFANNIESADYLNRTIDKNWEIEHIHMDNEGTDIALSINVTHLGLPKVQEHVKDNLPQTSTIISATIAGGPSFHSIRDGNHILLAVIELLQHLKVNRNQNEENGCVHIFIAGPNTFAFTLGQYLKSLGKINLYEFDFEGNGSYQKTIEFPI